MFDDWILFQDESDVEYQHRIAEGDKIVKQIESYNGDATRATVKRDYLVYSGHRQREAKTVSQMVDELDRVLQLYETGGAECFSPNDFTLMIIDFLKNGSENDEGYLCDTKKSPGEFFYRQSQYVGNTFINELLKRHGLNDDKHQTIDDFPNLTIDEQRSLQQAIDMAKTLSAKQAAEKKQSGGLLSKLFG